MIYSGDPIPLWLHGRAGRLVSLDRQTGEAHKLAESDWCAGQFMKLLGESWAAYRDPDDGIYRLQRGSERVPLDEISRWDYRRAWVLASRLHLRAGTRVLRGRYIYHPIDWILAVDPAADDWEFDASDPLHWLAGFLDGANWRNKDQDPDPWSPEAKANLRLKRRGELE